MFPHSPPAPSSESAPMLSFGRGADLHQVAVDNQSQLAVSQAPQPQQNVETEATANKSTSFPAGQGVHHVEVQRNSSGNVCNVFNFNGTANIYFNDVHINSGGPFRLAAIQSADAGQANNCQVGGMVPPPQSTEAALPSTAEAPRQQAPAPVRRQNEGMKSDPTFYF